MLFFESIKDFLNEDLGNLRPFSDIPEEWKRELLQIESGGKAGRESEILELPIDADYKDFLKKFKDDNFIAAILKINGKSSFLIKRESQNKFQIKQAEGEYSVIKKKREEREKAAESNEGFNIQRSKSINEARRRFSWYDSALVGSKSIPELQGWIKEKKSKNPESQFQLFLIYIDKERVEKRTSRMEANMKEDPLKPSKFGYGRDDTNKYQKERYDIYAEKKRAELDKKLDSTLKNLKDQIIGNLDKALDSVVSDMRRGYSWNADAKAIGEGIMKNINLSSLKKFIEAYDAIEPSPTKKDPVEASRKLKKLGF